jgi:hypothetical protein
MSTRPQPGDIVDVTIKGVQFAYERTVHSKDLISIRDEHGCRYTMPPQAAVRRADLSGGIDAATLTERISKALAYLDNLEAETSLQPYVAAGVREALGLPPRHWPPQPGDVWHDGFPFGPCLWFAQVVHGDSRSEIVMVPTERGGVNGDGLSPEALLNNAPDLRLKYRNKTGDND